MTIITVQIGKTLGFLGRVEFATSSVKAGLSQVNGAIGIATRFGLSHDNRNDLPQGAGPRRKRRDGAPYSEDTDRQNRDLHTRALFWLGPRPGGRPRSPHRGHIRHRRIPVWHGNRAGARLGSKGRSQGAALGNGAKVRPVPSST